MSSRKTSAWRPALAATTLAVAGAVPLAQAADNSVVVRDAETGQLRAPTAEEARAINGDRTTQQRAARAARSTTATATERTTASGAVGMELDESTHMYSVARTNPDGSVTRQCVQGADKAKAATLAPKNFAKPMSTARTARGAQYEDK